MSYKPDISHVKDDTGNHYFCKCGREIEHENGEINGRKMCLVCFFEQYNKEEEVVKDESDSPFFCDDSKQL